MVNKNEKDPISQAESIFEEARQGKDKDFSVELPFKTVNRLLNNLSFKHQIKLDVRKGTDEGYSSDVIHEENMLGMLFRKIRKVVAPSLKKGVSRPDKILLSLSEQEVDFLNDLLLKDIKLNRQLGMMNKLGEEVFPDSYTPERVRSMQEINLDTLNSTVSTLIELNLAFVKAGGNPRPEFRQFYEG